jgi:hypothetical protein
VDGAEALRLSDEITIFGPEQKKRERFVTERGNFERFCSASDSSGGCGSGVTILNFLPEELLRPKSAPVDSLL